MPAQTVTQAVANRSKAEEVIAQYRSDFATVLPSHIKPATWVRLAQGALRRNDELRKVAERNPGSFLQALLEAARLGHEPGSDEFYLVPFGSEVQGIESYRGIIERIYRAGGVNSVRAEVVCDGDTFRYDGHTRPEHTVDWFGKRGEIVGAYAYAEMVGGGTSKVVIINGDDIADAMRESRGSDKASSPWKKHYKPMVLKTVVRRLEPWVPKSAEYRLEQLRAAAEVADRSQLGNGSAHVPPHDPSTGEVVDAELVEDGQQELGGTDWPEARKPGSGVPGNDPS